METGETWIALMIGNSRLHWAWFEHRTLQLAWDTSHLSAETVQHLATGQQEIELDPKQSYFASGARFKSSFSLRELPELWLASVVPAQAAFWQAYPNLKPISLDQISLGKTYSSLGIDRALAVLGAGQTRGWPVLVLDAGTALTFTGADGDRNLVGGAILPGLGLQLQSLARRTAALPAVELPQVLPARWAMTTPEAIQSGVLYTTLAGVQKFLEHWWQQFPQSAVVFTGGDANTLFTYLQDQVPGIATQVTVEPHLIFQGMQVVQQADQHDRASSSMFESL